MNKTTDTAADLIERSARSGQPVDTRYTVAIAGGLYDACADMTYLDGGDVVEYVGTSDGAAWTVRMGR